MTLEELGRDYLRQAEELLPRIESKEQELKCKRYANKEEWYKACQDLLILKDIYHTLSCDGWHLIRYYEKD